MNSKTTKEIELEKALKEALNKIEELEKENIKKDKKYSRLETKFSLLQKKFNKLLIKVETKTAIIKVNNHNKFYSTKESSFKEETKEDESSPINEVELTLSKKKPGRKKGSKNFANLDLESLVKETVTYDVIDEYKDKGYSLTKIGEDVSYLIKVEKEIKVIKVITPKYIRSDIKEEKIYQAIKDTRFPHSICTPSLASDIINAKYNLDVPLYRYSKYLNSQGIPLSDMDLTNYVKRSDELLLPLYEKIRDSLVNETASVIHSDETPLEVLDYLSSSENKRKNGYIFAYVSSYFNNPIYLYDFNKTRETVKTKSILNKYKGYMVTDGYAGYNDIANKDIKIQRCFAHIRRKFYDIVKVLPDKLKEESIAYKMVKKIDRLFAKEKEFIVNQNTPEEIYELRHKENYINDLNDIYDYLHSINPESGTPLYAATKYFLNIEKESKTFMEDGHIPISNNICERAIKPFAIMRRNVLFAKTEKGASISGRLFTIVQTARANGLIVDKYIEYVLENINKDNIDDLLPWSDKLPKHLLIIDKKDIDE